jgi:hypothetical protein
MPRKEILNTRVKADNNSDLRRMCASIENQYNGMGFVVSISDFDDNATAASVIAYEPGAGDRMLNLLPRDLKPLFNQFDTAAQEWGWASDQGSSSRSEVCELKYHETRDAFLTELVGLLQANGIMKKS